jgi:hypothetical protein
MFLKSMDAARRCKRMNGEVEVARGFGAAIAKVVLLCRARYVTSERTAAGSEV